MQKFNFACTDQFEFTGNSGVCPKCGATSDLPDIEISVKQSGRLLTGRTQAKLYFKGIFYNMDPLESMSFLPTLQKPFLQFRCPGCGYPLIMVDTGLENTIAQLNQHHAYTMYSCYGHEIGQMGEDGQPMWSVPYIKFAVPFTAGLVRELMRYGLDSSGHVQVCNTPNPAPDDQTTDMNAVPEFVHYQKAVASHSNYGTLWPIFRLPGMNDSNGTPQKIVDTVYATTTVMDRGYGRDLRPDMLIALLDAITQTQAGKIYCNSIQSRYPTWEAWFQADRVAKYAEEATTLLDNIPILKMSGLEFKSDDE